MVFSSHVFIFYFLPLVLLVYYAMPGRRLKHFTLTLLSYVFYGWANPRFVVLMFFNTLVDYIAGLVQAHNGFRGWRQEPPLLLPNSPRTGTQKIALVLSISTNLSLLAFFKYFNFASDNLHALQSLFGASSGQAENAMRVTLPLGISFYTFQSMSYSIDVYRGDTRAMKSANDYFCFVAMFHQLVAGPIVRFSEIADQLKTRSHTIDKFARGVALFSLGMAMKIVLANPCGKIADTVFAASGVSTFDAWYGATAYAFQILFDFSGYSEMAVGLGLMMGFVFALNFNTPYQAQSLTDFWRRWHISLSTWLRDYLYIPLGGSRRGVARTYFNLLVTMLLGGLWHGASWNFLVWGGLHGGVLAWERFRGATGNENASGMRRFFRVTTTFLVVLIGWVFFRASDLPSAWAHLGSMIGVRQAPDSAALIGGIVYQPYYLISFALAAIAAWTFPTAWKWTQNLSATKALMCVALLWLSLILLATQSYNPFIYFIF